jgi:hypothetical protein
VDGYVQCLQFFRNATIQTQAVLKNTVLKYVKGNWKTEYAHITALCNYDCLASIFVKKT